MILNIIYAIIALNIAIIALKYYQYKRSNND